jgi:hypothetical protein
MSEKRVEEKLPGAVTGLPILISMALMTHPTAAFQLAEQP